MMRLSDLGEYRVIGERDDGWHVVVTANIIRGANTFEIKHCYACGLASVRSHDAEAWRIERSRISRCARCGGRNVQVLAWIDPNANTIINDDPVDVSPERGETWCADCEDNVDIVGGK